MPALPSASATVYNGIPRDFVVSPDGLSIYAVGVDGTVRSYNAETGTLTQSWAITTSPGGLAISPDGSFLVVVERDAVSVTGSQWGAQTTVTTHRIDLATGATTSFPFVATGYNHAFADVEILADGRAYFTQSFSGSGHTSIWALDFATGQYQAILGGKKFSAPPSLTSDPDSAQQLLISVNNVTWADQTLVDISSGSPTATWTASPLGPGLGIQAFSAEAGLIAVETNYTWRILSTTNQAITVSQAARTVLDSATGLAFDSSGANLYVMDSAAGAIVQISTSNWDVVQSFDLPNGIYYFNSPYGNEIVVGPDARYFIISAGHSVLRIDNPTLADAIGTPGADLLTGTAGDDVIIGYQDADTLIGLEGNDTLNGGTGADSMQGGAGNDRYVIDDAGDVVVELANEGADTVEASINHVLRAHVEHLTLTGAALTGTGNDLANTIRGNALNNILSGGDGDDLLYGNEGDDLLNGGAGADLLDGGAGNDTADYSTAALGVTVALGAAVGGTGTSSEGDLLRDVENINGSIYWDELTGNEVANMLNGGSGNDTLTGNGGADVLNGGTGADLMIGGTEDDIYYVDDAGDRVVEQANSGNRDEVRSTLSSMRLGDHVEMLTYIGTGSFFAIGNDQGNNIIATAGSGHTIYGMGGDDGITSGDGDDALYGDDGNDVIYAGGGNDSLTGGAGTDILLGMTGDDTYHVDRAGEVFESANEGNDTIVAGFSYTLDANVENLILIGAATRGTGNALDNVITGTQHENLLEGGAGNDTLNGGGGADTLIGGDGADVLRGGTGDDTYYVDRAGEVFEGIGEGVDTVVAGFDYTLDANVENLTLTGSATRGNGNELDNVITGGNGNDTLIGGDGADTLIGGNGNDRLFSGEGADVLIGGAGNDEYWVSDARATLNETDGNGSDTLILGVSYTLAAGQSIEFVNLSLRPVNHTPNDLPIDFTGNEFGQRVEATDGANVIHGGGGSDWIRGFGGDDTIHGDDDSDTLEGGDGADQLFGGAGSDLLNGGNGIDVLRGGIGNDNYHVDRNGEVFENAGEGIDTVFANMAGGMYLLDANVENLTLQGGTFYGVGNELANQLTGSALTNWLMGGDGDDRLDGKGGDDVLYGDAGADIFVFGAGEGVDTVADFRTGVDKLDLTAIAFANFDAVLAATRDDGNGNSIIELGGGNRVILSGVLKAQLTSGDVMLAAGGVAAAALTGTEAAPGLAGGFDHLFDSGPELVRIGVMPDDAMLSHTLF